MNVRKTSGGYIVDGRPMSPERFAYLHPDYVAPEVEAAEDLPTGFVQAPRPVSGFAAAVAAHRAENAAKPKGGLLPGDVLTSEGPKAVGDQSKSILAGIAAAAKEKGSTVVTYMPGSVSLTQTTEDMQAVLDQALAEGILEEPAVVTDDMTGANIRETAEGERVLVETIAAAESPAEIASEAVADAAADVAAPAAPKVTKASLVAAAKAKDPIISAAEANAIAELQLDMAERINRPVVSTVTDEQIAAADRLVARKEAREKRAQAKAAAEA